MEDGGLSLNRYFVLFLFLLSDRYALATAFEIGDSVLGHLGTGKDDDFTLGLFPFNEFSRTEVERHEGEDEDEHQTDVPIIAKYRYDRSACCLACRIANNRSRTSTCDHGSNRRQC